MGIGDCLHLGECFLVSEVVCQDLAACLGFSSLRICNGFESDVTLSPQLHWAFSGIASRSYMASVRREMSLATIEARNIRTKCVISFEQI